MKNSSSVPLLPSLFILFLLLGFSVPLALQAETGEWLVRLENREGGEISVSEDGGKLWNPLGMVLKPNDGQTNEVDDQGFTAADWAPDGAIAATAVNALHIKTHQGEKHAVLFTIQPREFRRKTSKEILSYFSSPTSIFTDIPAGEGIFGAKYGPPVGNPVFVHRADREEQIGRGFRPRVGDVLIIPVRNRGPELKELHIMNRVGGWVFASFRDGSAKVVASVARPVGGIGRFGGSQYAGRGEVRANHPGVLCISSSNPGEIGGFQIVPLLHAGNPNLKYVWGAVPAWLIVQPLLSHHPPLEGRPPLFLGGIRPRSGRCLVRCHGGPWVPLPERTGLVKDGLAGVTELRLLF